MSSPSLYTYGSLISPRINRRLHIAIVTTSITICMWSGHRTRRLSTVPRTVIPPTFVRLPPTKAAGVQGCLDVSRQVWRLRAELPNHCSYFDFFFYYSFFFGTELDCLFCRGEDSFQAAFLLLEFHRGYHGSLTGAFSIPERPATWPETRTEKIPKRGQTGNGKSVSKH